MKANLAILPGDCCGPEVTASATAVLKTIAEQYDHQLDMHECLIGGAALDAGEKPLPDTTRDACQQADAVLLGAVGGPRWADPNATLRPEQGLLGLRQAMGVYANIRPVSVHPALVEHSPLKNERLKEVNFVVVRELTGGAYFGHKTRDDDAASDECRYSRREIERVARRAFELASSRSGRLTSVDKANVLETSRLWRTTIEHMERDFSAVTLEHQLVDSMAMLLVSEPARYDVIVTENLFGDILTDEAAALTGSLGLLPSASLGDGHNGLYEPIHGSAPELAGRDIVNPIGAISSAALLLRYSLGLEKEATVIESAIDTVLTDGPLPPDLGGTAGTAAITEAIVRHCKSAQAAA